MENNEGALFIDFEGNQITENNFKDMKMDISQNVIEGFSSRTYFTCYKNSKIKSRIIKGF